VAGSGALLALLQCHRPDDEDEARSLEAMRRFATTLERPFSPEQPRAHFTGSAVIVDPAGASVCLVHHRKLGRWLQPGGHADPADGGRMERTALREAREETGLAVELHPRAPLPLDVDVHEIPARPDRPAHLHLDVRVLVVAAGEPSHDAAESYGARWFGLDEAERLTSAEAPQRDEWSRLFRKTRRLLAGA
jgi:8-oxo-dGTP pyrophosphatase MutT (NUDIX family)